MAASPDADQRGRLPPGSRPPLRGRHGGVAGPATGPHAAGL